MSDPSVLEVPEQVEVAPPTNGSPGMADAFSLMREELRKTTPAPESQPAADPEPPQTEDAGAGTTETDAASEPPEGKPTVQPTSRRGKAVEKVKTEAEQKIEAADAARQAAEARAAELEAEVTQFKAAQTDEGQAARAKQLEQEYGSWIGTAEEYAEAQRLSRMDPDAEGWDWDKHKQAVNNLNAFDERRKWADLVHESGKKTGAVEVNRAIAKDFLETLADDLPEDKRTAYREHKDGIPGAVRFYAETVYAPKLEALEQQIAEKDAEIERLTRTGARGRSPAAGGSGGAGGGVALDYNKQSPEELMAAELRQMARQNGRHR